MIGCEYEALVFDRRLGTTLPYHGPHGIQALLCHLRDCCGWKPYYEGENVIALTRKGQSITLEPGGQFEMSGAAVPTLREIQDELDLHVGEVQGLESTFPIEFRWLGMNPTQGPEDIQWMPKARYGIMRSYLPTRGKYAHYMMGLTATVQANLDTTGAEDFAFKLRMSTGVSGLANALFANSPTLRGEPSGYKSFRYHVWSSVDPDRCFLQRFIFETDAGYEDYVDWALDVPMFFLVRGDEYIDISGRFTFRDLLEERIEGHAATLDDWKLHMSTLFPDVRARPHLEFRTCDVVPPEAIVSCPALWKGLIYSDDMAIAAWDLVKAWTFQQRIDFALEVARDGLATRLPVGRGTARDACRDLVEIARLGLVAQAAEGLGEDGDERFLGPLQRIVDTGRTFADS